MATREFLCAELDQSELVATVQRDQIRLALEKAGKPPGMRVDGGLAKELAYRGAVRAVLEGKIDRLGKGYSVVLRVVDAESPKVILTEGAVAKDLDGLVPALSRLSRKLRNQLGERRAAIRATRDFDIVATPSFEAYKLFLQGQRTQGSGSNREAIPVIRDALDLDPDFAIAWWELGICFQNIGQTDSARVAFDEALRRPQRLTATDRLNIEASRATANEDFTGALIRFERILRDNPTDMAALTNSGVTLVMLGRFREALQNHRKAGRASPFGPGEVLRSNEVVDLLSLGRFEDARKAARYLGGPQARTLPTYIEIAAHNWAAAESVATAALTETNLDEDPRRELLLNLASAQAGRGALEAAANTLILTDGPSHGAAAPFQDMARRARLMLSIVSRGAIPLPADTWAGDHSIATVITRGLRAANAGDGPGARRLWNEARARPSAELTGHGVALALLEARVDGFSGKWREAVRTLLPIASQPVEIGAGWYPGGISVVRWFLADAYERLGQPDSAAIYLERVVSEAASSFQESHLRGITWPFAHWRLVMLYARMGRIEDARRHWRTFNETFTRPDQELKPLIEEARAEMVRAEEAARRRVATST